MTNTYKRPYDERLDLLTQNAIKVIKKETPDDFHENNLKYLSEQSLINIEELRQKTPDKILSIINSLD